MDSISTSRSPIPSLLWAPDGARLPVAEGAAHPVAQPSAGAFCPEHRVAAAQQGADQKAAGRAQHPVPCAERQQGWRAPWCHGAMVPWCHGQGYGRTPKTTVLGPLGTVQASSMVCLKGILQPWVMPYRTSKKSSAKFSAYPAVEPDDFE